jgi:SAM-dependent methyltransferase
MTREQSTVFGEVAELYHRHRPDYPAELFHWIVATAELPDPAVVVDVGCGTGKSSAWFVARGHRVIGIEPDPAMAAVAVAAESTAGPGSLEISATTLEDWPGLEAPVDLVVSGQAWHWTDPATRFDSVADALADTGWLCVYWNRPDLTSGPLAASIGEVYERHVPDLGGGLAAVRFPGSKAAVSAATPTDEFDLSGRFSTVEQLDVSWERTISAAEHLANLQTQSDHRLLEPAVLGGLLDAIGSIIDAEGGSYEQAYTTHAYAARVLS